VCLLAVLCAVESASGSTARPGSSGLLIYVETLAFNPLQAPSIIDVVSVGGRRPRRVMGSAKWYMGNPAWSPDGKRIAFEWARGGDLDIWTANADGSHARELTFSPAADQNPAWSPDGRKIIFQSDRLAPNRDYDLFTMNADGSDQHALVTGPGDQVAPAWSPDGTRIAYAQGDFHGGGDVQSSIWSAAADGSDARQLTTAPGVNNDPVWSPDGSRIAFESNRGGDYEVYVMNAGGAGQQPPRSRRVACVVSRRQEDRVHERAVGEEPP
jgi:Tol biopolymer transport system component